MNSYFPGKVAVITGAGSGIGRALAHQLGELGCHLALSDINEVTLKETADAIRTEEINITLDRLDVADRSAFSQYATGVVSTFGSVDIVINNAGVGMIKPLKDCTYDDFERLININLWGVLHGSQEFLPHLLKSPEAHLINISSIFGLIGVPDQGIYNLTKFAIRGYSEALRQELEGTNVHVASVHPGFVKTDIAAASVGDEIEKYQAELEWFDKAAITSAEDAASAIIRGIYRKKSRILVGADARMVDILQRLMPVSYSKLVRLMHPSRN